MPSSPVLLPTSERGANLPESSAMSDTVVERAGLPIRTKSPLIALRKQLALASLGLVVLVGAAWYGNYWWNIGRFIETTDDAYVGGNVTTLSPHVAGFVSQILLGDNQFVKAGELVITLDDRD